MIRTSYALALTLTVALCFSGVRVVRAATPSIRTIGPSLISVGDPDFSLRVLGDDFDKTAVVLLDGDPLATTFVSKKRLQALVPASVAAAAGSHTVTVRNADNSTSGAEALTVGVASATVVLERVNPDSVGVNTSGFSQIFRLTGSKLDEDTKILVYGKAFDVTVHEKNVVDVVLPPEIIGVPGLVPFQAKRGGEISNMLTVPIFDKAATISSVTPVSIKSGSEATTLTIVGTGFSDSAIVRIGNVDLTPTSIKPQQIKVLVPASVLAGEAQLPVYVVQPTGLSNVFILRVTPADDSPALYAISPETIQAGAGAVRIQLTGANFTEKSKVFVNGVQVKTTFVGKAGVTFKLTDEQTSSPGATYTIEVRNPDGSVTQSFTIEIVASSVVSTIAGKSLDGFQDGSPDEAKFRRPSRLALGPDGLLYVADQLNNAIRRLNPANGFVETLAGDGLPGYVDSGDSTNQNFSSPRFNNPLGVAVADDGTIYVADYGNNVIRRMRSNGSGYTVDTVAGANELIKNSDTRDELHSTRRGLQGFANGTGSIARFRGVDGMALGSDGTLYIADSINHYIRGVDTTSTTFDVTTVSGLGISGFTDGARDTARYSLPLDVALSPDETTLYVADFNNARVRSIDLATGSVTTVAGSGAVAVASGGPLVAAFTGPIGVTVATDGTIYVTDHNSNTVRQISTSGVTTTLSGGGKTKFKDGIGPIANFKDPRGIIYVPSLDALFVADQGHQRIRKIAL